MKIRRLTDLQDAMLVEDARTSRPRLTPDQLLDKLINGYHNSKDKKNIKV